MKGTIKAIRASALGLLVVIPAMLLSGVLTASPAILSVERFATYRSVHTLIVPLLLFPLFYVHSLMGIRYMLLRRREMAPLLRTGALVCWTLVVAATAALYVADRAGAFDVAVAEISDEPVAEVGHGDADLVVASADGGSPAQDGGAASADAASADAASADADSLLPDRDIPAKTKRLRPRAVKRAAPRKTPPAEPTRDAQPPSPPPAPEKQLSGGALVRGRCGGCHPLKVVYGVEATPSQWQAIVSRMIAMGAKLAPAERAAVVSHLSSR